MNELLMMLKWIKMRMRIWMLKQKHGKPNEIEAVSNDLIQFHQHEIELIQAEIALYIFT